MYEPSTEGSDNDECSDMKTVVPSCPSLPPSRIIAE